MEITTRKLEALKFKDNGKCNFTLFERMNYWVRNGVCLFYNTPIQLGCESDFYIGYVEMRQGKYVAVGFRWIKTMEDVVKTYEAITGKSISGDFSCYVEDAKQGEKCKSRCYDCKSYKGMLIKDGKKTLCTHKDMVEVNKYLLKCNDCEIIFSTKV